MSEDLDTKAKRIPLSVYLWAAAVAALVGFIGVYLTQGPNDNVLTGAPTSQSTDALNTGEMTSFEFTENPGPLPEIAFQDGAGKTISLEDFKGKAVLVNLWATWCAPCREEMPSLDRLQGALGGEAFEVIALSLDRGGAEPSKKFLDKLKVKHLKLYVDPKARSSRPLKAVGMPTSILFDPQGKEIGRLVGTAEWDSEDAQRLVKSVLPKTTPSG